jgi:hypothetical protein
MKQVTSMMLAFNLFVRAVSISGVQPDLFLKKFGFHTGKCSSLLDFFSHTFVAYGEGNKRFDPAV